MGWVNILNRLWHDERGGELVEVVICLPVVMSSIFLFLSLCQIVYACNAVNNAAASGARIAVIQTSKLEAEQAAGLAIQEYMKTQAMGIQYSGDYELITPSGWDREELCTCVVRVKVKTIMPVPASAAGGFSTEVDVSKAVPMMIEKGV